MQKTTVTVKWKPYDIYIGRGSIWGNPFVIGRDGDRNQVIKKYRGYIKKRPELLGQIQELKGKRLACFCAPKPCHGDILAELANNATPAQDLRKINNYG